MRSRQETWVSPPDRLTHANKPPRAHIIMPKRRSTTPPSPYPSSVAVLSFRRAPQTTCLRRNTSISGTWEVARLTRPARHPSRSRESRASRSKARTSDPTLKTSSQYRRTPHALHTEQGCSPVFFHMFVLRFCHRCVALQRRGSHK